jgi:SAM-dependent methyltransferase
MTGFRENYDAIAQAHIAHWQVTGGNPFIPPEDVAAFADVTVGVIGRYCKPGDTILDAGCAMGDLLDRFPDRIRHGVDISSDYLAIAASRGIVTVQAMLEALPYPDAMFDLVIATDVLEHVLDLNAVVREIIRVLKPGGYIVARCPNGEDLATYADPAQIWRFVHLRRFDVPTFWLLFNRIFDCPTVEFIPVRTELIVVARKP